MGWLACSRCDFSVREATRVRVNPGLPRLFDSLGRSLLPTPGRALDVSEKERRCPCRTLHLVQHSTSGVCRAAREGPDSGGLALMYDRGERPDTGRRASVHPTVPEVPFSCTQARQGLPRQNAAEAKIEP